MNVMLKERVIGARMRLAQHYVDTIVQLASIYDQGFENTEYAVAAFDAEQEQIESWFDWLRKRAKQDDEAVQLFERFLSKGFSILRARVTSADLFDWYTSGLEIIEPLNHPWTETEFLTNVGKCASEMGQKDVAEAMLNRSHTIARELGDPQRLANSLLALAYLYQETSRYEEFKTAIDEALTLFRQLQDISGMCQSIRAMSWVAILTGDLDFADRCNQEAYELALKTGVYTDISIVLSMFGSVAFHRQRLPEAMDYFKQALDFGQRTGAYSAISTALMSLGSTAAVMNDVATAEMYMLKTIQFTKRTGLMTYAALTLCNLGALKYDMGDFDSAIDYLEQSIVALTELKMGYSACESFTFLVPIYILTDRYSEAQRALREGLLIAQQIDAIPLKQIGVAAAAFLWLDSALKDNDPEGIALALQWFDLGNEETLQVPERSLFEARMPDIERILGRDKIDTLVQASQQLHLDTVIEYILSVLP